MPLKPLRSLEPLRPLAKTVKAVIRGPLGPLAKAVRVVRAVAVFIYTLCFIWTSGRKPMIRIKHNAHRALDNIGR